jgi:hypothetical protein
MSARTDLCGGYQATGIPTATRDQSFDNNDFGPPDVTALAEVEGIMLPKGQNWILMLALFLAVPAMRSPITVPRNRSRDDRETLARLWGAIGLAQENRAVQEPVGEKISCGRLFVRRGPCAESVQLRRTWKRHFAGVELALSGGNWIPVWHKCDSVAEELQ